MVLLLAALLLLYPSVRMLRTSRLLGAALLTFLWSLVHTINTTYGLTHMATGMLLLLRATMLLMMMLLLLALLMMMRMLVTVMTMLSRVMRMMSSRLKMHMRRRR